MISVEYNNEIDCGELGTIKSKVDLSTLEKDISTLAQKNNVPIKIRHDKYKIGKGLLSFASESHPCIVVSNANHSKGYYEYVISATFSSGVTHVKIFSTGISNNKGIVAVYGQNKGSILSSVIANSAQKKLNEENIYYEKLLDIFAAALENADLHETIEIVRKYDFDLENVDHIYNKIPFSKICRAREIIYSDSVEKHDVQGMLKLSHAYEFLDRPEDAFQVLDILIRENNSEAMFRMGSIYSGIAESGPNIERIKNDHKRLYWLKRAAFLGNAKAVNELGDFYRFDHPDHDKAYYWYTIAAKAGSAQGYYNRAQLLEKDLRDSKIGDSIREEIAKKVEYDYHYAFELVREMNLQAKIAGSLGEFYKWGVMSSIYGQYIIDPNPFLALYFYYVAMDCSDNGFYSKTYNELSNELSRKLNDDNFTEIRDGVLFPYMEERGLFYPPEGYLPEDNRRNLERVCEDAKNGNLESINKAIDALCFNFSTYKMAKDWVDFYISVDKVNGLVVAGKLYFEYALFSGDADNYFSKATECMLEAYELASDSRQKKEAAQILNDIYRFYYCDDEKAKNYIVDDADEPKKQHITTNEQPNSSKLDGRVKKINFGAIIAVVIITVIIVAMVVQSNNRKLTTNNSSNKADGYESNAQDSSDFIDSYETYAGGYDNDDFQIDENLFLLNEAGIDAIEELLYANPVFYGKSDDEREEILKEITDLKQLKSIIQSFTYGPNNYKSRCEKNYDIDSKLTSICLYDNGEKYSETQYIYDEQSRLIEKRDYEFGDLFYKDSYEYDSEGKLIAYANGFEESIENYTYNDSGILVEKIFKWNNVEQEDHYLYYYDDKGRRIAVEGYYEDDLFYNEEIIYDGRHISRNHYYSDGSEQKIEEYYSEEGTILKVEELYIDMALESEMHSTTSYDYNDDGRLIKYSHSYKVEDYDGNVDENSSSIDYDYNDEGKFIGYSVGGESRLKVEYNENGQIQRVYYVDSDMEYVFEYY